MNNLSEVWKNRREEYQKLNNYFWKRNCPFCEEVLKEDREILYETKYWLIYRHKYPYFEKWVNLLVSPKRHIEFKRELSNEEYADFRNIDIWLTNFFTDKWLEYFSLMRETKWNKSVEHLHYHFFSGIFFYKEIDWEDYLKVVNDVKSKIDKTL